jgi:hypothetical protein
MPDERSRTPSVAPGTATRVSGKARPSFATGYGGSGDVQRCPANEGGRPDIPAAARGPSLIERAARIAFWFVVMNYWAVAGLVAALRGKKVWR